MWRPGAGDGRWHEQENAEGGGENAEADYNVVNDGGGGGCAFALAYVTMQGYRQRYCVGVTRSEQDAPSINTVSATIETSFKDHHL